MKNKFKTPVKVCNIRRKKKQKRITYMETINIQNYIGQKFGHFTVLDVQKMVRWGFRFHLVCDCGKKETLPACRILSGHCKSCGCKKHRGVKKPLRRENLINQKFGKLTVKEIVLSSFDKFRAPKWRCLCDCGNTINVHAYRLKSGKTQSCGCIKRKDQIGNKHHAWTGHEKISGAIWNRIVKGASSRDLEFNITIQEAWDLFLKQNGKCALSGVELKFAPTKNAISTTTASLDRIDSSKGYTLKNIQWVEKSLNMMKTNLSDKKFIQKCYSVTNYQKNKKAQELNLEPEYMI